MTVLTNEELATMWSHMPYVDEVHGGVALGRAIESAVLAKLAQGVSVEPHYHNRLEADGAIVYVPWYTPEQLQTAIAAARVAALEEAAKVCEARQTPGTGSVAILNGAADAIRALIGKEST